MSTQVRIMLSLVLLALGAYGAYTGYRVYKAQAIARSEERSQPTSKEIADTRPLETLADFEFTDTAGKPYVLSALDGQVWLASFFFSSCPGPCAQMNRAIAGLQNEMKDDDLKFVSITVDPNNDTPEVLANYARTFQADPRRWLFLSGPFDNAQRLGNEVFKVPVGPKMHTERVMLVDKGGNMRGLYLTSDPNQMLSLKRKIRDLLEEPSPQPGETASARERSAEQAPAETGDARASDAAAPATVPAAADEAASQEAQP